MGFDQQNTQDWTQGMDMFGDLFDFLGPSEGEQGVDTSGEFEEMARMTELDARQAAMDADSRSKMTASQLHDEKERGRSKRNAEWGQSNIAMSGSKELVRESTELSDKHAEEDMLAEGESGVKEILSEGKRDANIYRIANGLAPSRSTLSLGSTIYDYKR